MLCQKSQTIRALVTPPPIAARSQPVPNPTPDRPPDKTGNNREALSEIPNDPRLPTHHRATHRLKLFLNEQPDPGDSNAGSGKG
jgi:hypothetical protein